FDVFAGKKSAQIREILISESAWEEMTCLFAPSLVVAECLNRVGHNGSKHLLYLLKCFFSFIIIARGYTMLLFHSHGVRLRSLHCNFLILLP
ncbi:hypothetical protein MQB61_24105, partial [Escherichia coli]|nr:hypothetical protein [Escherichia coli]